MAGYDQTIRIKVEFEKEARHFFNFLQKVGQKYARPTKINYRYLKRGRFYIIIDGGPGGIDALFQELILNRGLYYYSCTLRNRRAVIDNVIHPIYVQFIERRFSNPQSRFLRKHILGKYSQNDFVPTDRHNKHGYELELLFRKWDIELLTNKSYLIELDALLTQFLLEKLNHKKGQRSLQFGTLVKKIGNNFVFNKDVKRAFNRIHELSRKSLHRLVTPKTAEELNNLSNNLLMYFQYLDDFEGSQKWKTIKIRGKRYKRIKYGDEGCFEENGKILVDEEGHCLSWARGAEKRPCHDCNVIKGQYHVEGCDAEVCPKCGGQFISYDCGIPSA